MPSLLGFHRTCPLVGHHPTAFCVAHRCAQKPTPMLTCTIPRQLYAFSLTHVVRKEKAHDCSGSKNVWTLIKAFLLDLFQSSHKSRTIVHTVFRPACKQPSDTRAAVAAHVLITNYCSNWQPVKLRCNVSKAKCACGTTTCSTITVSCSCGIFTCEHNILST